MAKGIKDNLFYIGVLIFSLTLFTEHLLSLSTPVTCFLKGFAAGIQIVGVVVLIKNRIKGKDQG